MEKDTEDNIKYFKNRVNYYFFDVFHLYEFELNIEPQLKGDVRASCYWHEIYEGAGIITFCYSKDWIQYEDTSLEDIDKTAFHEVLEALLSEVNELMARRFISKKDIPNAIHRIIRRMENVVYPIIKNKL